MDADVDVADAVDGDVDGGTDADGDAHQARTMARGRGACGATGAECGCREGYMDERETPG